MLVSSGLAAKCKMLLIHSDDEGWPHMFSMSWLEDFLDALAYSSDILLIPVLVYYVKKPSIAEDTTLSCFQVHCESLSALHCAILPLQQTEMVLLSLGIL